MALRKGSGCCRSSSMRRDDAEGFSYLRIGRKRICASTPRAPSSWRLESADWKICGLGRAKDTFRLTAGAAMSLVLSFNRDFGRDTMRGIAPILIVEYPGSRLYDTINAKYLSLDELRQWWSRGISFEVHDSETGEDVTRDLFK